MLYGRSYHRHQQLLHVWVTETIIVTYHVSLPQSMLLSPIVPILNSFQDFSFSICWGKLKTIRFGGRHIKIKYKTFMGIQMLYNGPNGGFKFTDRSWNLFPTIISK